MKISGSGGSDRFVLEPFHLLEISIISAQDLYPETRSMSTYAMAWIQPDRKLCTRVDSLNHTSPHWNDKFIFRVDEWLLRDETAAVTVEIYCLGWFRDTPVGSVRIPIGNLLQAKGPGGVLAGICFGSPQVRRPSGRVQGVLNVGVTIIDASLRSVPLYAQLKPEKQAFEEELTEATFRPLRRAKSVSEVGSVVNGGYSESVTGTLGELEVADRASSVDGASVAGFGEDFLQAEVEGSLLEDWRVASVVGGREELRTKLERWRSEIPVEFDPMGSSIIESPLLPDPAGKTTPVAVEEEDEEGPAAFVCSVSCGLKPRKKKKKANNRVED